MKFRLTLFAFLITTFAFCQSLEGRWVNSSFSGEENLAYHFSDDNIIKMYYAGEEIETKQPIKFSMKEAGDFQILEMKYTRKSNGFSAELVGLVKFLGKNQIELEFFDKKNFPEDLEFTAESLIYTKE